MRHRMAGRKLGRTTSHRWALLRNMATSLFRHERITTTVSKAKELRPFAERLITLAKKETLHARRQVLRHIKDREVVAKLFDKLGPRYATRPGGYSRIVRTSFRRGDNSEMALIELIDTTHAPSGPKKKKDAAKKKKAAPQTKRPAHRGTARQEALADVVAAEEMAEAIEAEAEAEAVEAEEPAEAKAEEPAAEETPEEPKAEEPAEEPQAAEPEKQEEKEEKEEEK